VHDFDAFERGLIDQVQEGVDAAALRAVRVADAVNKDVDLVAGEAAHEHAGHRRTGGLQVYAGFLRHGLCHYGRHALIELFARDHRHRLQCARGVLRETGRRGDGHLLANGGDVEHHGNRGGLGAH
jgi:hypothetical protein